MEPYVYLQTPLWEGIPLTIEVASPVGPTRYEGSAPLITKVGPELFWEGNLLLTTELKTQIGHREE